MISEFFLFPQMIIHPRRSFLILVDVDSIQTRVFVSPLVHPLSNLFVSILIILATLNSIIVRGGYIHSRRITNAERCVDAHSSNDHSFIINVVWSWTDTYLSTQAIVRLFISYTFPSHRYLIHRLYSYSFFRPSAYWITLLKRSFIIMISDT